MQIPRLFAGSDFNNYIPVNENQKQALAALTGDAAYCSYYIYGDYGSGKTHLLYSQFRKMALDFNLGVKCFIRSTKDLLKELQDEELGKSESIIIKSIEEGKDIHLFWDDADKFKVTDFKLESIFDLIDKIYRNCQHMTITSNCNLIELQEKLSPAICRRIDDICTKVKL
jgi:DNA replication protein DnaC